MNKLNLPSFDIRVAQRDGRPQVWDPLRRKYVATTPEEWVRQHFVNFLIAHRHFPAALMANEVELQIGGKRMRCDTLLYYRDLRPRLVVEYKAPSVTITERVFHQVQAYNLLLRADYLVVSNGLQHICCHIDYERQTSQFLPDIPDYAEL